MALEIRHFFDKRSFTVTYLCWDSQSLDAVVMDPVMDYWQAASEYGFDSLKPVIEAIENEGLRLKYILETHAHADHLSGSQALKEKFPGSQLCIGSAIREVQKTFGKLYNLDESFKRDGSQFDRLLEEGDQLQLGQYALKTLHTPGHTRACYSYLIDGCVFTGDALFMPDFGVGRCDFPGGSAEELYDSVVNKLYSLPEQTRCFTAHDYQPGGREFACESTIAIQKNENVHLKDGTTKEEFVKFRTERDAKLSAPKLLLPSIEVNVDGGRLPNPEENGVSYLKIPMFEKSKSPV
jgi:glyoxylase-like metal-dependent hydrolase (beta-lactamase superfamily II)